MQDGKVSREAIVAFLEQGEVRIEEVTKDAKGFDKNNPTLTSGIDLYLIEAPEDSEFAYGVDDDIAILWIEFHAVADAANLFCTHDR